MVKTYHTLQQWNHWLTQFPGSRILETEKNLLSSLLAKMNGNNVLLIGVPEQYTLIRESPINNNVILSPLINKYKSIKYIECGLNELAIMPSSIDVVILPHTLEFIDTPRKLLIEACNIVKPGGDIIITGFNPLSLWGVKKLWEGSARIPWSGRFMLPGRIKKWLELNDFEFIRKDMIMFRPPSQRAKLFDRFYSLEWLGTKTNAFFGGIYTISAKANVIPLTPIKLHWEQSFPGISTGIPSPMSTRDIQ